MKRNIIQIDENRCNGCGLCINACHEGALQLINGKAKLVSESYCDGLGDCLPQCPVDAIKIVERDVAAYDVEAVKKNMAQNTQHSGHGHHSNQEPHGGQESLPCGCPGSQARTLERKSTAAEPVAQGGCCSTSPNNSPVESQLRQWPCQIKLVPAGAPYFDNAHLLIAASCTAYAYAGIHNEFMRNKITIIGCPKLDDIDYSTKLTEILRLHEIKSVTVLRMEVPCCGGIVHAVKKALIDSGKMVPWNVVTITTDGGILES